MHRNWIMHRNSWRRWPRGEWPFVGRVVLTIACLHTAALVAIVGVAHAQSAQAAVKLPNEIEFKAPVNPGVQTAVLYGDPSKDGVYVARNKLPAGLKVMPHTHPDAWRTAVVLSGTLYFATGDVWDESKLTAYPPGTFYTEPVGRPHFVWARDGDVVLQVTAMGPTGSTPVARKQ
jgi:quercetin dioxygenase-like cupin family protein